MKEKLILKHRGDYNYFLVSRTDNSEALVASLNPDEEIFEQKLSKQNCDELFGVVDVEKLAEGDCSIHFPYHPVHDQTTRATFVRGFNKAMELNKDKVFTMEDMKRAIRFGFDVGFCSNSDNKLKRLGLSEDEFIQSLQQPTEIEVEIEMEDFLFTPTTNTCFNFSKKFGCSDLSKCTCRNPKLDPNGCLILKKK